MTKYRHENKYVISFSERNALISKASSALKLDPHVNEEGKYHIRSLYFDDYKNSCYYDNEGGVDPRCKYRIRYYNRDTSAILLEKKSKYRGLTNKISCALTYDECRLMMKGIIPNVTPDMDEVKKQLFSEMRIKLMKPKVIVSYDRIPFVQPVGNVRVTFDHNITASSQVMRFLDADFPKRPIQGNGESVLEIKWDETFPMVVKDLFDSDKLIRTGFSKYYNCRKYSTNGGVV